MLAGILIHTSFILTLRTNKTHLKRGHSISVYKILGCSDLILECNMFLN